MGFVALFLRGGIVELFVIFNGRFLIDVFIITGYFVRACSYLCGYFSVGMVSAATHALQLAICLLSFPCKCDVSYFFNCVYYTIIVRNTFLWQSSLGSFRMLIAIFQLEQLFGLIIDVVAVACQLRV